MPQNLDENLLRRLLALQPGSGSADGYQASYDFTGMGDAGAAPYLTGITRPISDTGGRYGLGQFEAYSPTGEYQGLRDSQPSNATKDFLTFLALAGGALGGLGAAGFDVGLFDAMGLGSGGASAGSGADAVSAGAGGGGGGFADVLANSVGLSPEQLAALESVNVTGGLTLPVLETGGLAAGGLAAGGLTAGGLAAGGLTAGGIGGAESAAFADMAAGLAPGAAGATNPVSGVTNLANGIGGASGILSGITNAISNNPLGTLGAVAGAIGGASQGAPTESRQNRMDPRMDPYVYGNDGVLSAAQRMYRDNPSGVNANMRAGFDRTLGLLSDPSISAGYGNMRNVGQGLLNTQVAGNPFNSRSGMSGFGTSRMDEFLSRRGR